MLKTINQPCFFFNKPDFKNKIKLVFLSIFAFQISNMRNALGAIGFLVFLIGLSFKMMHWPFASILFITGTLISIVYFLLPKKVKTIDNEILDPIDHPFEEDEIPKSRKIGDVFRNIGIVLIIISVFFSMQHYPYSAFLLWGGVLIAGTGVFILYKP
tara:strand:+ start:467 stop:937 length:471 start_codon:yes stop_codon:yes gene_type:complete